MAVIVYAWEFGANLGHIGTFLPVARALRERGHDVRWVVTHPHQAARLLPKAGFDWLAAPVMPEQRRPGPPLSYADILLRFGYAQADDLLGLTVAWRELLRLTGAQLVLADHAPTAILAARTLGLPVMLFGGGFFCPPPESPTPAMRPWEPVPLAQLQAIDAPVIASINAVLQQFGCSPVEHLAELFAVAESALLTFPELDHYAQRGPAKYWGTLPAAVAEPPQWPSTLPPGCRRVFAYLRPESAHFEAALQALSQSELAALIYAPNVPVSLRQRHTSALVRFADEPVDLNTVAREADAALTYASPAATIAFLFAGKPALMLPGHLEQFLFARRVADMGAGLLVSPEKPPDALSELLAALINEPTYRQNAQAFAAKYAAFDQTHVVENLVKRIEELTRKTPP